VAIIGAIRPPRRWQQAGRRPPSTEASASYKAQEDDRNITHRHLDHDSLPGLHSSTTKTVTTVIGAQPGHNHSRPSPSPQTLRAYAA